MAKRQREQKKREKRLAKKAKMEQRRAQNKKGADPIPTRGESDTIPRHTGIKDGLCKLV